MNGNKRLLWFGMAVAGALLWLAGFYRAGGRLTYIERTRINEDSMRNIVVSDAKTVLEQEFVMPYELLWSVEIKTGTFGRNNNSFWQVEIKEKESGKKVYGWKCNASELSDGEYHSFPVRNPVRVNMGKQYTLSICSGDVTGNSALAFYTSEADSYAEGRLFLSGSEQKGDLCMRVTGGEKDGFWTGWYLALTMLLSGMAVWCIRQNRRGKSARLVMEAAGVACLYLLFMYLFSRSNTGTFTDEWDNIWGGMLIAKGKVLYRDYYTQHTPFGYYLCAVFAWLGAGSLQQFRLLYYLLSAAVWGGLYYRHSSRFGKVRMLMLPLLQIWLIMPMFFQSPKILADHMQGMCMIVLTIEFLRYWEDGELGKSRSLIAAACIFVSITSAFVSVFALAPLAAGVLAKEILIWKNKRSKENECGFTGRSFVERYGCFLGAVVLPFGIALLYFTCTHAIKQMYRMAYQFNTMVYNTYQEQYGRVKWKPFFLGVKGFFTLVSDNFNKVITGSGNTSAMLQFLLAVSAAAAILRWGIGYCPLLDEMIQERYERISEGSFVWKRKKN